MDQAYVIRRRPTIEASELCFTPATELGRLIGARELSPVELEEIKSLPAESRVRADRIIQILDEEGASTPELRVLAYKALGVLDADTS